MGRARSRTATVVPGALLALIVATLVALLFVLVVYPAQRRGGRGREIAIAVHEGERMDELSARLEDVQLVDRAWLFAIYARLVGADERLRSGELVLTDDMTPREVLQRISYGFGSAALEVLVPEGLDRFEIGRRLERRGVTTRQAFLAATTDAELLAELDLEAPSAEGYLFPDTYRLHADMPAAEVVRRMVQNHRRRLSVLEDQLPARYAELEAQFGWGPHQILRRRRQSRRSVRSSPRCS
jgi:UPF0755 protein